MIEAGQGLLNQRSDGQITTNVFRLKMGTASRQTHKKVNPSLEFATEFATSWRL